MRSQDCRIGLYDLSVKTDLKKEIENKIDVDKELKRLINTETNRQLNQFSNIYFNKIKKEIQINEI